ncbi:D-beta-hydroxybutyrate dehydrogenase, mitochondrial-like [Saccostrea echinata]|uniref:D-beta-hydroxybutyrate dehydrogenase, mitochondrial-like n=1 Tax=Saccostrea echinata TaxID=191078 RepID=UPI002A82C89E|nr:D-beta-hydroxybutyrate dehydrogenase, mitochondrial-like [Saccostrea echinata]
MSLLESTAGREIGETYKSRSPVPEVDGTKNTSKLNGCDNCVDVPTKVPGSKMEEDILEWLIYVVSYVILLLLIYVNIYFILALLVVYVIFRYVQSKCKKLLPVKNRAVLVTGCDRGFGFHFAKYLDDVGFIVYAGVLSKDGTGAKKLKSKSSKRLHVLQLDVTSEKDIKEVVTYINANTKSNGLWGVINNAGVNVFGDVETTPMEQYERCLSINLYGMIRVTQNVLPLIRQSQGRIVNISSVMGRYSSPGDSAYHISKHGIESMTDSLRMEMRALGVGVSIVEPGHYDAATTCSNPEIVKIRRHEVDIQWERASEEVKNFYGKAYFYRFFNRDNRKNSADSPDRVIDAVVDALLNESPRARYLVPGSSRMIDVYAEIGRFYGFFPEIISDVVLTWFTGSHKPQKIR